MESAFADRLDETALESFLERELGPADGIAVRELPGGNANETYLVTWGTRELVLRVPPPAEPAPELLHGIDREYDVLTAIETTPVPAPSAIAQCADETVVGAPFYLMEYLTGDVIEDDLPERFETPAARRRVGEEVIDTLAALHTVEYDTGALDTLDEPDGYLDRQVERLTAQLTWAEERTAAERHVAQLHTVGEWLADNVPEQGGAALVHGDYKPDNLMFAPGLPPTLVGVLDWELCARGDPLADLGWLLSYWHEARDPSPLTADIRETYADHDYFPMLQLFVTDYSRFMEQGDIHSRRDLVERYEAQTDFSYAHDRFYRALATYKLAVICEGFYRMHLEEAVSAKPTYPVMEMLVPVLAEQATQILDGDCPL